MKKIFLALLAVVAMVACEDNLEGKSGVETEFDFAFNEAGECYSVKTKGITQSEFVEKVVGYGWEEESSYEIFDNGNISSKDYWDDMIGGLPIDLYFESDKCLKAFSWNSGLAPLDGQYGYYTWNFIFDNTRIILDGDRSRYLYLILTVTEDTMVCIEKLGKDYALVTFKRMTAEELEAKQQKYYRNWSEELF